MSGADLDKNFTAVQRVVRYAPEAHPLWGPGACPPGNFMKIEGLI